MPVEQIVKPADPAPPRVSIGVPVYNGQRFLSRSLDSILSQTYRDFELIVCDNASTDATESICREYAARDGRVRYVRAEKNLGVVPNFNRCVELARGEYFHWNAADDMIAPTFLSRCVEVLDADASVVVTFAASVLIDEADAIKRTNDYDADADHPEPHVRFANLINLDHRRHSAQEVYGLIRTEALRRTSLYEPIVRTDSILLARLALLGRFRRIDEPLFLNREHAERSVQLIPGRRATPPRARIARWFGSGPVPPAQFWNPALKGKLIFPEWTILGAYHKSLRSAALAPRERNRCRIELARFALRHSGKLARDVLIAAEHALLGVPR